MSTPRHGITLFTAIGWLIATLVVIQLWLVAAALDALLAGETDVLLPAAIASAALAAASVGLLAHGVSFDRGLRKGGGDA